MIETALFHAVRQNRSRPHRSPKLSPSRVFTLWRWPAPFGAVAAEQAIG
jgi:hypothetical protein